MLIVHSERVTRVLALQKIARGELITVRIEKFRT